ncbi:hypothetical protein NXX53_13580 [Bacteroides salyersiae]|nr:hypothetical protein [Bacteroides salyersiae]
MLEQIARWNKFTEAYGAYLYYSNRAYVIADYNQSDLALDNDDGIYAKLKRRWDKRTGRADALIVDLVNYGRLGRFALGCGEYGACGKGDRSLFHLTGRCSAGRSLLRYFGRQPEGRLYQRRR